MSGLVLGGSTSGTITLQPPAVAGSTVLNLPSTSGDILTTGAVVTAAQGGTGLTSVGTSGNVLTSNGTGWVSSALPAGGVTSLNGQTGAITDTNLYAIGSYVVGRPANTTNYTVDSTLAGSSLYATPTGDAYTTSWSFGAGEVLVNTGTWRCTAPAYGGAGVGRTGLWVRIS